MHISVLAYDNCMGAEVFGFADLILVANRICAFRHPSEPAPFTCDIVSAGRSNVTLAGGAVLQTARLQNPDLLIVPAFDLARSTDVGDIVRRLDPEIDAIRQIAAKRKVASICGGAFLLAEAGILAGRRATTAWAMAEVFMRRYPTVRLNPKSLLVQDGEITTSGAFTAFADLALSIVTEQVGAGIARAVARFSLISTSRTSQAPYIEPPRRKGFGRDIEHWLAARLTERYSLGEAAAAFGLSTRTLLRRVKAATGKAPLELLQDIRLEQAKRLLETTDLGIAEIVARVGYQDIPSFYRLFQREVSISPAAYRRDFRS